MIHQRLLWHIHRALMGAAVALLLFLMMGGNAAAQVQNPQSGSTGLQGKISAPPPTAAATISIPRTGQSFTTLPVTVSGLCQTGLLVKLFKNNVFAGSVQCTNNSFSLLIDLFNGQNDLVARVYDTLDQAGPDSNTVTVNFSDNTAINLNRVSLTSNFAKRGANPGQTLTWPIILSGGTGPYAVSIDWGDGKTPDLKSLEFPGPFDIQHKYDNPGVYNIIVKATDKNGSVAFLQLVGVGNGALTQDSQQSSGSNNTATTTVTKTQILWQPAAAFIPFILLTFWLGKKHELKVLRRRIEEGQRPF